MIGSRPSVVGIDLGNDSSVVCLARNQKIDVLQNEAGSRKTPSVVAFASNKQRLVGSEGASQVMGNFKNSFKEFKRLIGRRFEDPEVQQEREFLSYSVAGASGGESGDVAVSCKYGNDDETITPEHIASMLFAKLKRVAEATMEGQVMEDCVVACPNFWTDAQRRALQDTARLAGLNPVRIMSETTAVALNYGLLRPLPKDPIKVMFVDMGLTSTQVAVVEFATDTLKVLGQASDRHLGGRNYDQAILSNLAKHIKDSKKLDVLSNAKATLKLRRACTKVKQVLSANTSTNYTVEYIMDDQDVSGTVKREEFDTWCSDLNARLRAPVEEVLKMAKMAAADLHSVEIVGGATRIPSVQATLQEVLGQPVRKTCDGDESVARGCALQCAILSPSFKVKDFKVKDANPYPIELVWYKADGKEEDGSAVIFKHCNTYPSTKEISFSKREAFKLTLRYKCDLPIQCDPVIGTWTVSGMEDAAKGKDKAPKIKCKVRLDGDGLASVCSADLMDRILVVEDKKESEETKPAENNKEENTEGSDAAAAAPAAPAASEPATGDKKAKTKLRRVPLPVQAALTGGLDAARLAAMKEREQAMVKVDAEIQTRADAENRLESYILSMSADIDEGGLLFAFAAEEERSAFKDALRKGEDWMYDEGYCADLAAFADQLAALEKAGEPIKARRKAQQDRKHAVDRLTWALEKLEVVPNGEQFSHLSDEEKKLVADQCAAARAWLKEETGKQAALSASAPASLTAAAVEAKLAELAPVQAIADRKPTAEQEKNQAEAAKAKDEEDDKEPEEMLAIQ